MVRERLMNVNVQEGNVVNQSSACESRKRGKRRSMLYRVLRHLAITLSILGLLVFNFLGPYYLAFVFPRNSVMRVGIHYLFDDVDQDLRLINETGFRVVKTNFSWDGVENSVSANQTEAYYNLASFYGLKTALIVLPQNLPLLRAYLLRWGAYVQYIQVLNEPELTKGWEEGALLLDDEIRTLAKPIIDEVRSLNLNISLYVNFSPAFLVRPSLVLLYENMSVDFLGLDIYMESGLELTPIFYSSLQKLSGGNVIISEFGVSTVDENRKADFIIAGLNFFRRFGVSDCWLVYWTGVGYGIRGTLAQARIREWIQANAS